MKKRTYTISKKASVDLEEIWLFTFENWSREQADRYFNLLLEEIEFITENPESGKSINHIRENYRAAKVKSHLIFYKIKEAHLIEVIRILHERMDIENRLKD